VRKQPRESRRGTNVAAGDANAGPGGDTAIVAPSKARAEHGRRSGRHASVGEASSSEAERAGGSSEQVVRTRDTCAWMASRAQPTAAVAQAHAAQRAGNADRVVTAPSASLVMCTTFKAARICVRHVPNANLIS